MDPFLFILLLSFVVFFLAVIKILLLKEQLFVYLKLVIVFGLLGVIFKIIAIERADKFLVRLYLIVTLIVGVFMATQLNRVSLRSSTLNLLLSVAYVASVIEVFTVPDTYINPEYTVLPIRNSALVICGLEMTGLSIVATKRIMDLKRYFGKLLAWEEKNAIVMVVLAIITTIIFILFWLSIWIGISRFFIWLNYSFIFVIGVMLLSLSITTTSNPFFVSYTGIEGIAVVFGGVTLTSIGKIPDSIIIGLENTTLNSLRIISKDKILIYWRTTIELGGERRKLSLLMLGRYLEKSGELFFNILSSRIKDRLTRDYLLTKKLMDLEYFVKQIESKRPPKFLREEFRYTIEIFRRSLR